MHFHNNIDEKVIYMLNGKELRLFRHLLSLLVIGVIVFGMIYKNSDGYYSEYGLLYQFIGIYLLFVGAIYFNLYFLVPKLLLKGKLFAYSFLLAISMIFTLFAIVLIQNTFSYFQYDNRTGSEIGINIISTLISIGLIIMASSTFPLFRNWTERNKSINELETATIEAELQQLKNQINPHFLFNTINNANIKVEKDRKSACHIITKLSELLRYQLTGTSQSTVILKNDITFLTDYLELEKTRRDRFSYKLDTEKVVSNIKIPPLLFIPFVENAVKHSVSVKEGAYIRILFQEEKGYLHFYCENTKPATPSKYKSGGLGLKNIKRRLELLYGNNYTLRIDESDKKYIVNLYLKI
jgi:sensor histidine kinase YesM